MARQKKPAAVPQDAAAKLPQYIKDLAELRAQHEKLSWEDFAQKAFALGVYPPQEKEDRKPANRGTLYKILERARNAGLL